MEEIIKDFASWLDNNARLKVDRQIPPFENSDTIANYYINTILPDFIREKEESELVCWNKKTLDELAENNPQGTANIADDRVLAVGFNVFTYTVVDNETSMYCHWSKGLNMVISKNGVEIKLESEEIQQIVKSLPRTIGGKY